MMMARNRVEYKYTENTGNGGGNVGGGGDDVVVVAERKGEDA